jgi:hypothetical protein
MKRWTLLGLVILGLGLLSGCGVLAAIFGSPAKSGEAVSAVGAAVTGANPLVGLILTLVGGGLTALGEVKKTSEGR